MDLFHLLLRTGLSRRTHNRIHARHPDAAEHDLDSRISQNDVEQFRELAISIPGREPCLAATWRHPRTMMGYPCLRVNGAFFACVERATGHLIVKLPGRRVAALVATGQALPFAPNGRTFREWAAFPVADPSEWRALLAEAREFTGG